MSQPPYGNQPPYGGQPPHGGQPNPGGSGSGWGQPGPTAQPGYGQPPTAGIPSYNQPTQQFNQPPPGGGGYGGPPGGPPPFGGGPGGPYGAPPPKRSPLPFIIGGLVLLLVAGGVGLFLVLNKDDPTPVAQTTTAESTEPTEDTSDPTEDTSDPTEDTETSSGDEPNFAESEDVAIAFVQSMVDGDYDAAFAALCVDGQDPSDGDGFADGQALADDFFLTLGASTVTGGDATAVVPSDIDRDVVSFDLDTDVGPVSIEVQVLEEEAGADLTICGYDTV